MRTVVVKFWGDIDHPKELGRVELDNGVVVITGQLQASLEGGVLDYSAPTPVLRQPSDGDAFLDAVMWMYRGGYVRAEEEVTA